MTKHIQWNGQLSKEGYDILKGDGGCIVCPTKVGYIIMTSDKAGLERKFEAKARNRNKPGVVLCGSIDELRTLAQLNPEIEAFYQKPLSFFHSKCGLFLGYFYLPVFINFCSNSFGGGFAVFPYKRAAGDESFGVFNFFKEVNILWHDAVA